VPLKVVQFLALALTALALVPSGAHLFALPNKINLVAEQYFIVQSIYRGWSLFGIVLIGALIANLALALLLRGRGAPFVLALFAFLCMALTLVVFFIWTYPANQATNNWTMIPDHWEQLRREWEYSHAANAVVTFAAFCAVTLSVLTTRERTPTGGVGVTSGERPH
jgi:ABC-type branched-subunit amino acid transport system permease subunit